MTRSPRTRTACATLAAAAIACGARTGLPTGAVACNGTPLEIVRQRPNLYFVIDRSGSMAEGSPSKWSIVREDVTQLITTLGAEAEFGAAWFPAAHTDDPCAVGAEVMSLRPGDGLPSSDPSGAAGVFLRATATPPVGGTPTAETFTALTPELAAFPGTTFAILATDGGPDCNAGLSCAVDACTLNIDDKEMYGCTPGGVLDCCDPRSGVGDGTSCLDGTRSVSAVAALAAEGVSTFVIGVPGSEAYGSVLDRLASAGGTARSTEPSYYPVDTSSSSSLTDALASIAARIAASCKLTLSTPPPAGATNVVIDGATVPQAGADGWTLAGDVVTLLGQSCDTVQTEGEKVVVTEGCATVVQ